MSVTERLKQQDDYTNEHPYDTAPNRSSAFHIAEDSPPNTSQNRTRSTTKQSNHCLENQKGGYYLRYTNTGKRSCRVITDSSQDDYTDEHPCDIVSNHRTTPQHFILQKIALLILPKSEPGQLQNN